MVKQIVKIEPPVTQVISSDGSQGWREEFPDVNKYNLKKIHLFGDDRITTPILGFNTEVWLLDGTIQDINSFISDNPIVVTKMTPVEAKTLADTIRPAKQTNVIEPDISCIGGIPKKVRTSWTSPV